MGRPIDTFNINVTPSGTIDNVKAEIRDGTGISTDQQRLMVGKVALGAGTLSDLGVVQDAVLQLSKPKPTPNAKVKGDADWLDVGLETNA